MILGFWLWSSCLWLQSTTHSNHWLTILQKSLRIQSAKVGVSALKESWWRGDSPYPLWPVRPWLPALLLPLSLASSFLSLPSCCAPRARPTSFPGLSLAPPWCQHQTHPQGHSLSSCSSLLSVPSQSILFPSFMLFHSTYHITYSLFIS